MAFDSNFVGVFRGGRGIEPMNPRAKVGQMHVLCGSYDPLHDAHRWVYEAIDEEAMTIQRYGAGGYAVAATTSAKYFEISTSRVGKPDLTQDELMKRLRQFSGYANVLVTTQPLFVDKYEVLRPYAEEVIFHIGYDNYVRLVEINGLQEIGQMGCSFCIWPRNGGRFTRGPKNCFDSGVDLPDHLAPISSTQIRNSRASG
jgi:nicotinic acid mononucleotide adenylyltransferase